MGKLRKIDAAAAGFQCPECQSLDFWYDVTDRLMLGDDPDVVRCKACGAVILVSHKVTYTVMEPSKGAS